MLGSSDVSLEGSLADVELESHRILNISWDEFDDCCNSIIASIANSGQDIDYVCGIPRGGMILAVVLSNRLHKPMVNYDSLSLAKLSKILVVDDIVKSGTTVKLLREKYAQKGVLKNVLFASLFCNANSISMLDFCAEILQLDCNTVWVVLPWDNRYEHLLKLPNASKCYDQLLYMLKDGLVCPKCGDRTKQIKKGRTKIGVQRAHCRFCNSYYTPFPKGYSDDIKYTAVIAYMSGYSSIKVSSILGIDSDTIISWVSRYAGGEYIRSRK
jgi:hypoxanthine phosphoribosyltransferase/transposase-like protein